MFLREGLNGKDNGMHASVVPRNKCKVNAEVHSSDIYDASDVD